MVGTAICIVVILWLYKATKWMCVGTLTSAKTYACGDVRILELAAWAAVMKKDSAHSLAKKAPKHARLGEVSPKTATMPELGGEQVHPTAAFVKMGKEWFDVTPGYGRSLNADQKMCNDSGLLPGSAPSRSSWHACPILVKAMQSVDRT